MIYYTGDLHFGHANCLKHDNRPFDSIEEMDKALIQYWNDIVTNNDEVYINGDFAYKNGKSSSYYLKQLKGHKHLIIGNHDKTTLNEPEALKLLESVDKMMHVSDNGVQICICHYPLAEWNGYFRGAYHIYGHIHGTTNRAYQIMKPEERALNCGCMINNYVPVTFKQLVENNKIFKQMH
jgi:calcineurin-like phosphoesterase family protein